MSSSTPSASKRGASTGPSSANPLRDRLATVLPRGHRFGVHHISTPPTRTEPLCAAPPGQRPDKTYRESHFLAVSIHTQDKTTVAPAKRSSPGADQAKEPETRKQALVFAVEVLVFTTAYQTTLFVSKADSTGYLHLLNLPKGTPSPIRQVCATFLAYLLDHRRRNHVQSVVNLFARAQAQYLFPGSVRNKGKHVLDDWGLVRWWCKALNPLMEGLSKGPWTARKGYLLVPGLEEMETRAFIPRTKSSMANWVVGHPLEQISHHNRDFDWVPPRCLIPGYPDDPKCRFRDELDEEVSKQKQGITAWKSVKSLEQFWEMMAFRQECSSGRLTGFVWLVFDPNQPPLSVPPAAPSATPTIPKLTPNSSFDSSFPPTLPATPPRRRVEVSACTPRSSPLKAPASPTAPPSPSSRAAKKKAKKKLSGHIVPRAPKIKTHARKYLGNRPIATAYYYWPPEGRGDMLLDEAEYKRIVDLLLHLDFSTLDKAVGSSQRWLNEVGVGAAGEGEVVGRMPLPDSQRANGAVSNSSSGNVTNLTGLIRRKNVTESSETDTSQRNSAPKVADGSTTEPSAAAQVNVLGSSLVRKKKKPAEDGDGAGVSSR